MALALSLDDLAVDMRLVRCVVLRALKVTPRTMTRRPAQSDSPPARKGSDRRAVAKREEAEPVLTVQARVERIPDHLWLHPDRDIARVEITGGPLLDELATDDLVTVKIYVPGRTKCVEEGPKL
jgi:hypothetical protein